MKNANGFLLTSCLTMGLGFGFIAGCSSTPGISGVEVREPYVGQWGMTTVMGSNEISAVLTLAYSESGELEGTWDSRGQRVDLIELAIDGSSVRFAREMPGGQRLSFTGTIEGEDISGNWTGSFGELASSGTRDSINPFPDRHSRPIVEKDGTALLWANEDEAGEASWFDVTDARIDPVTFQYGIGKDTISSIDEPVFVSANDELLAERGVLPETEVLGVVINGEARAYPVDIMSIHEVVNDNFGGEAFAVLW
ncbi:MAG: hypothetical protein ACI8TQ_002910 [Planctomycetota bacterium]|jgi:hypothetical protein